MANWQSGSTSGWGTEATQSGFDASSSMSNMISSRGRTADFSNFSGIERAGESLYNSGVMSGLGEHEVNDADWYNPFSWGDTKTVGYDIVGIKATEVEKMRGAIREYVGGITSYLAEVIDDKKAQAKTAFRGSDAVAAVEGYLDKVQKYINNLVSQLLAFSDKLADIGNAWFDAQQKIASNVNASSGAYSEGTKYEDNLVYRGQ